MANPAAANEVAQAAMPQLNTAYFGNLIFWSLVGLIAMYFILSRVALPRIGAVLAERSGTIGNDLAAAEELHRKAREAEAAYEQALTQARAEAGKIVEDTRAAIKDQLAVELAKADEIISARAAESEKTLAAIRDQAVENVTLVAKDTVSDIVALFGVTADAETLSKAVDAKVKG